MLQKVSKKTIVFLSGALALLSFVLHQFIGYHPLTIVVMLLTTLIAGTPIFLKAIGALRYKIVGIDLLVTIAVTGALIIGEYWEAAAVTFLFMLGDYLESRTIEKTRASIREMLDSAPKVTTVRRDGVDLTIDSEDVVKGDIVVIKPGEKVSIDGTIIEGEAYINQAAITGESIPESKGVGDAVYSGSIVESGYLLVDAVQVGEDTTFARILRMVEEAQDKKAKSQKFLEKFSRYYTPAVIVLAVAFYFISRDIRLALTLLVIACPGALVISAPVSIVAGIGNGAKNGVLIKGGEIMEKLGTIKAVAFDKTGTLTEGKPEVTKVQGIGASEREVLKIAAIGEAYSEHPLARAILRRAEKELGQIVELPEDSEIIAGHGLTFHYAGDRYLIGNRKLLREADIDFSTHTPLIESEEDHGQTTVLIAKNDRLFGIISIADTVRHDAAALVSDLKKQGIQKIVMLTGDNERAARAIATEVGLDGYYSELLPEDKVRKLSSLQKEFGRTAMVGDGVNDAPALAGADPGIAIGGVGSDVAMETADVVLMSAEVSKLSYAVGLSRATVSNMKQNIAFALIVAGLLIVGVMMKTVNLSFGMLVHELSVFLVIVNAVRLLGYGKKKIRRPEKKGAPVNEPI